MGKRVASSNIVAEAIEALRKWRGKTVVPGFNDSMGGAYASFEEHQKGSISKGKFADFVVLSQDPRVVSPDSIARIQVEQTFVAGVKHLDRSGSAEKELARD